MQAPPETGVRVHFFRQLHTYVFFPQTAPRRSGKLAKKRRRRNYAFQTGNSSVPFFTDHQLEFDLRLYLTQREIVQP